MTNRDIRLLRTSSSKNFCRTQFLKYAADLIFGTGKAIGLVCVLGLPPSAPGFLTWPSFSELVGERTEHTEAELDGASEMFSVSVDTLAEIIQDHLQESCEATGAFLSRG